MELLFKRSYLNYEFTYKINLAPVLNGSQINDEGEIKP
jgi:hypothetical protein